MIRTQIFATQTNAFYFVVCAFKIFTRFFDGTQDYVLAKHYWSIRCFHKLEHIIPKIFGGNVLAMRSRTKCLTWESAAQDIKLDLVLLAFQIRIAATSSSLLCQLRNVWKNWENRHPAIPLALLQHLLSVGQYLNTCTTTVTQQFSTIDSTSNTGKQVELFDF